MLTHTPPPTLRAPPVCHRSLSKALLLVCSKGPACLHSSAEQGEGERGGCSECMDRAWEPDIHDECVCVCVIPSWKHRRLERKKAEELFEKHKHLQAQQQGYNMIIKLGKKSASSFIVLVVFPPQYFLIYCVCHSQICTGELEEPVQ